MPTVEEINEVRNELASKFRGAYDKAKAGRSPTSAIKIHCLRCSGSDVKFIENCPDKNCEFYEYRPYPPRKYHRPTNISNKRRCTTGQFAKTGKKSYISVSRTIDIPKSTSGHCRLKIEIVPENTK